MDRSKTGKSARNKGANAERELARLIRDTWGYETRRGFTFYHQSDVIGLPKIHIECKRVENLNLRKALDQAEEESKIRNDGLPVVIYRKNYGKWKVAMQLDHFLQMLGAQAKWSDLPHIVQMELNEWMDLYGDYVNE